MERKKKEETPEPKKTGRKKKVEEKKEEKKKEECAFDKLKIEHQNFVKEYVRNFAVGYKAYKCVYPKVSDETARTNASRLLTNANVKQAIDDEYKRIWKEKDSEIEKSKTYQMIHSIGNSDISDIINLEDGSLIVKNLKEIPPEARQCIQSVEYVEKETQYGIDRNIKVRLHAKQPALELRAKIQKMIDPKADAQQLEITIKPAERPDKKNESEEEV
jgi:phage terminase small subunit